MHRHLKQLVGVKEGGMRISVLLQTLRRLLRYKILDVNTVGRDSFSDPEVVKLFTLRNHRAEQSRTHAAAQISHDVK